MILVPVYNISLKVWNTGNGEMEFLKILFCLQYNSTEQEQLVFQFIDGIRCKMRYCWHSESYLATSLEHFWVLKEECLMSECLLPKYPYWHLHLPYQQIIYDLDSPYNKLDINLNRRLTSARLIKEQLLCEENRAISKLFSESLASTCTTCKWKSFQESNI